jgi:hypothetical protein
MNVILAECIEQVFLGKNQPMNEEEMGVYFIRGDNIAMIGQIDPDLVQILSGKGDDPIPSM